MERALWPAVTAKLPHRANNIVRRRHALRGGRSATKRATKPRRGPVANRATYMGCTVGHATRADPVARGCTPVTHRLHAGWQRIRSRQKNYHRREVSMSKGRKYLTEREVEQLMTQ